MLEFKSKALTIIVNIFLGIWQILQWIPSLILLAIFHNSEWYKNEEAGVKVIRVNTNYAFGLACFSLGPVIFVTPHCDENVLHHETGHSVQSLMFGPLFHFAVSIPSVCRFLWKNYKGLSDDWYLSSWPESDAEVRGHTHR